jgi:hypothetical protein
MQNKIIEGEIEEKFPYNGDNERGPAGDILINGIKLTCWSKSLFEELVEGNNYKLEYTEKESNFAGKVYINRNVVSIVDKKIEGILSEETKQLIQNVGEQIDKIKSENKNLTPLEVADKLVMPKIIKGESIIELGNKKFLVSLLEIK